MTKTSNIFNFYLNFFFQLHTIGGILMKYSNGDLKIIIFVDIPRHLFLTNKKKLTNKKIILKMMSLKYDLHLHSFYCKYSLKWKVCMTEFLCIFQKNGVTWVVHVTAFFKNRNVLSNIYFEYNFSKIENLLSLYSNFTVFVLEITNRTLSVKKRIFLDIFFILFFLKSYLGAMH